MNDLDSAYRVRMLERLMGEEPTEEECAAMWADRPKLEQVFALQEGIEWSGPDHNRLQAFDYELWRAKMRAELGSLSGILDALAICRENDFALPDWLHEKVAQYVSVIALPKDHVETKRFRDQFKLERGKLIRQKRAQIAHHFRRKVEWAEHIDHLEGSISESTRAALRILPNPPEVQAAINSGRLSEGFSASSIREACEKASKVLWRTWAYAEAETIRSDYRAAKNKMKKFLKKKELSLAEKEFLAWDVEFVRPDTLERLGLQPKE